MTALPGLLVGLATAAEAHACSSRPRIPTSIDGPRFRESEVEVTRTRLLVRCDDDERRTDTDDGELGTEPRPHLGHHPQWDAEEFRGGVMLQLGL